MSTGFRECDTIASGFTVEKLMQLIGRFSSPYVRRVAITMEIYGLEYDHLNVMPFGDEKDAVRKFNPLGRVPALALDNGEHLIESGAILDYLDGLAGSDLSLMPIPAKARRQTLNIISVASGATDKLVSALYEHHLRPKDMVYRPWVELCERQVIDGFKWLNEKLSDEWFVDRQMTQADVSAAVFWQFGSEKRPNFFKRMNCRNLQSLSDRLAATEPFQRTAPEQGLPKGVALDG
jgi:glutathione S-transferase